jgi:hypothetical protein
MLPEIEPKTLAMILLIAGIEATALWAALKSRHGWGQVQPG